MKKSILSLATAVTIATTGALVAPAVQAQETPAVAVTAETNTDAVKEDAVKVANGSIDTLAGSADLKVDHNPTGRLNGACVPAVLAAGVPLVVLVALAALPKAVIEVPIIGQVLGPIKAQIDAATNEVRNQLGSSDNNAGSGVSVSGEFGRALASGQLANSALAAVAGLGVAALGAGFVYTNCAPGEAAKVELDTKVTPNENQ